MVKASRRSAGWISGAGAMLAMSAVMLGARLAVGVPTLPELLADTVLYLIPGPVFSALLDTLRSAGKPILLFALFLGQMLIGALVGRYVAGMLPPETARPGWTDALKPALAVVGSIWLITVTLLMPVLGAGFFAALIPVGSTLTVAVYLVSYAVYAISLAGLYTLSQSAGTRVPGPKATGRRSLLIGLGWGIAGAVGVGIGLGPEAALSPSDVSRRTAKLPSSLTPIGSFYVVSKDLLDVTVDRAKWRLTVQGAATGAKSFDLQDLQSMSRAQITSTLTCISNEIGGNLLGTAGWTGVRLRDVLALVDVSARAYSVAVAAWDGYSDSVPVARALAPDTILAYEMDDGPLPDIHGSPLRLIVPGLYGIKNVKWITHLEVLDHGYEGYWQARGWTDDATVQTQSQIDVPLDRSVFGRGPITIGGIAFAGDRGIRTVELSTDGGKTWGPTTLQPALSPLTWVTWTTAWHPRAAGRHRLVVRAVDGLGQPQRVDVTPPIPDGATGLHSITVRVA